MNKPMHDGIRGIPVGGIPAYVERVRTDHGMVWRGDDAGWWCKCGEPCCGKHYLLQHITDCLNAYEAKVQDFAKETRRSSSARSALKRVLTPILLALRLQEAPLFDGEFFSAGFPPEEVEALEAALLPQEWQGLRSMRCKRDGTLVPGED